MPALITTTMAERQNVSEQIEAINLFELETKARELFPQTAYDYYATAWRKVFERAYQPIIEGLDLQRATLGQLTERFGRELSAETVRKCVSVFAAGAEEAGIPLAAHFKPKAREAQVRGSSCSMNALAYSNRVTTKKQGG